MKTQKIIITSLVIISLILSCGTDDGGSKTNFSDLFMNTSENIIQPQYNAFNDQISSLKQATETFTSTVNIANLSALQSKFEETYKMWQHTSLYEFGPAVDADILLKTSINSYPTNSTLIEDNISSGTYNLDGANNIFAAGLPALEYLIYGIDKNNNTIVSQFSTETNFQNRKQYALDLVNKMAEKTALVSQKWVAYHNSYIENTGTGNSSSLTLLFNAYLKDYEETKRNKFALPAGYATEYSIPIAKDENKVEGLYSGISFELITESIKAHKAFFKGIGYNGVDGIGFEDKLIELKAVSTVVDGDLSPAVSDQIEEILTSLPTFSNTLKEEIVNNNSSLATLNTKLQKLVPMIKIDMKSYFGVPVTSQDTDGD
ncbi:MAG: imelysin family protein [Flavobacteriales bacterium]